MHINQHFLKDDVLLGHFERELPGIQKTNVLWLYQYICLCVVDVLLVGR